MSRKNNPHQAKNSPARQNGNLQISQQRFEHRSGPLPAPEELERYNQVVPGGAERIFKVFEQQSSHRMALEKKVIAIDGRNSLLGLLFGFALGLVGLAGGIYLVSKGHEGWGTAISGTSLTALVSVFVYGSTQRRKEREAKAMVQK